MPCGANSQVVGLCHIEMLLCLHGIANCSSSSGIRPCFCCQGILLCPEQIRTCHKEVLMLRHHLTSQFLHFYVCQYVVRSGEICGAILYHLLFKDRVYRSWCQCWSVCVCVTCVLASCRSGVRSNPRLVIPLLGGCFCDSGWGPGLWGTHEIIYNI